MRELLVGCVCVLALGLGCATSGGDAKVQSGQSAKRTASKPAKVAKTLEAAKPKAVKTVDGLVQKEIDIPGVLFLRPDHGIGSYDALLVPEVAVNYKRKSRRLRAEMEQEFKTELRDSLVQAVEAAEIPLTDTPGACVMQIGLAIFDVDLKRSHSSSTLGQMTLVMEFRDSTSGQPLLRFATLNRIDNDERGGSRNRQLRRSFDEMIERLDVGVALRAAGLTQSEARPECSGTLARRGAAAAAGVSAR